MSTTRTRKRSSPRRPAACVAKPQRLLIIDMKSGWWSGDGDEFHNLLLPRIVKDCPQIESAARSSGARLCAETLTAAVAQAPTVVFRKSRLSQCNDARPPERLAAGRRVVLGHEIQLSAFTHREHGKAGGRRLVADDENAAAGIE